MKKCILLLFCSIAFFSMYAQQNRFFLTGSVAALPFGGVAFQPGLGYNFAPRLSATTEMVYKNVSKNESGFAKARIFRMGLELKQYQSENKDRFYGSLQFAYSARRFIDADSGGYYRQNSPATSYSYSSALIHSPVFSFAVKVGVEWYLDKHIFLDMFFGAGLRFISTNYEAKDVVGRPSFGRKTAWGPVPSYRYNETITRLHLPLGMKLGIRI